MIGYESAIDEKLDSFDDCSMSGLPERWRALRSHIFEPAVSRSCAVRWLCISYRVALICIRMAEKLKKQSECVNLWILGAEPREYAGDG